MNVIIATHPEDLAVEDWIFDVVRMAAEEAGEIYGVDTEVSVTLTDDETIRELNQKYRGVGRPTDVLSFALRESEEPEVSENPATETLGDIVISIPRAMEQATEYGHSLRREVAFLTVHGMLHLLGYDHMTDAEREEMETEQRVVMEALGIGREGFFQK